MDGSDVNGSGRRLPDGYELREGTPSVAAFIRLRRAAGMADRSREAVERGLPNTTYGVHVVGGRRDHAVGMARIVGDGGSVFQVSDMAVAEPHQGQGIGTAMMDALVAWLHGHAPDGGYVNLFADVDGFYERWGFERSAPASNGMWIRTDSL
ncbi:GNAT superfamily N-acetyltransferase [Halorubrum alkaliphilum]|uniref:GNAT superfamily N-acetyltransferase n=1 Tax=Halorubrum alkaliphilum TaxID=261290 RepID=A0A8T4GB58_9EURY|nr:GNAT family N-acetyltransferase [Halorubrum alkaliphilum]MBP1921668.1 GNAT superfamily N-acetyltransferase [Halorubrum alkaliphilum]